jgi:hypothetical protein
VNFLREQFLAGTRFAKDQDSRIRGRDVFDLFQDAVQCSTATDDAAERQCRVDLLLEVRVVRFELLPQTLEFREGARVGDRGSGLIREHSEPAEFLFVDRFAPEHREHAQRLVAEDQRLTHEAGDVFAVNPCRPLPSLRAWILDEQAGAAGRHRAYLEAPKRHPSEVSVLSRPALARQGRSRAGRQVKAPGLVGTGRSHAAALTDIPGFDDPEPRKSDAGLLDQPGNYVLMDGLDVPFT